MVLPSSSDTSEYKEEEEDDEMSSEHVFQNMRKMHTLHTLPHRTALSHILYTPNMFLADSHTLQEEPLRHPHP
jgi:hypothetical protein